MLISQPKEEDVGTHNGTVFPSCFPECQGQVVLGQTEHCRQVKLKNVRRALPHWSSGTCVSSGSRRMCSFSVSM